ncbi:hypothetical protein [Desulfopila aestuarii]|uniref:hypothetical protein n=1 Tax=Desulfopila aestuarii TaxID=231440 RepID=UPI0011613A91|nr:hypothetical protein [Desulfopila aestuarii]
MTLDYATCPHCGCRCEDDEYCAACARPFHDETPEQDVSIMGFLEGGLRSQAEKFKLQGIEHDDEMLKEEPEFDPTWSFLSSNIYHRRNS